MKTLGYTDAIQEGKKSAKQLKKLLYLYMAINTNNLPFGKYWAVSTKKNMGGFRRDINSEKRQSCFTPNGDFTCLDSYLEQLEQKENQENPKEYPGYFKISRGDASFEDIIFEVDFSAPMDTRKRADFKRELVTLLRKYNCRASVTPHKE